MMIRLLNVQGLSKEKYAEIEEEVEDNTVLCLTETQKKIDNINTAEDIQVYHSMRHGR